MAWIGQAVGGALGTVGTIFANISADKARGELAAEQKTDPAYSTSQYATQRYGLASTLLNARMPGAENIERNIYTNEANQEANIEKNATDGSQALAMGAANAGNTNKAFQNLGTQEAQDYYNRLNNYNSANQGMVSEGDKVYQDQARRWQDQVNITMGRNALRQQQGQNLVSLGGMIGSMGGGSGGGGGMGGGQ